MNNDISIDFETRSPNDNDLRDVGASVYAQHTYTVVTHAVIKFEGKRYLFNPASNRKKILKLIHKIYKSGKQIHCYNWTFEYNIIKYVCTRLYGWPEFPPDRFTCTMAQALNYGLPGKLEEDAAFLGTTPKDAAGHAVMLRLMRERMKRNADIPGWLYYDNDPEKHRKSQRYCFTDVKAEEDIARICPPLPDREKDIFAMDQRMNVRGISVDLKLCKGAIKIHEDYKDDLTKNVPSDAWNHFDKLTQRDAVKSYVNSLSKHFKLDNMQADTIENALRTCTKKKIIKLLRAYSEYQGQAINKYKKILETNNDGKLKYNLQYCGARATKRWSGRGAQLQNMNRPVVDYDEKAVKIIRSGDYKALKKYASKTPITDTTHVRAGKPATVADILKSYQRSILVADKGEHLAVNDYKSIEARIVMWLSGCKKGIKLFKDKKDSYSYLASIIYDKDIADVTKDERFVGKQGVLGLGYQMGGNRFKEQCAGYGVQIGTGLAFKTVNTYREEFSDVVDYWDDIDTTVRWILTERITKTVECGKLKFKYDFQKGMTMILPSGGKLYYHLMHLATNDKTGREDIVYYTVPKAGGLKMVTRSTYGGMLFENACQALARDLMADAMLKLEQAGYPLLLTIHDEIINAIKKLKDFKKIQAIILQLPKWAKGLPIEVEGEPLLRYRKI